MNLVIETPKKSLSKAFLKQKPLRSEIDLFKSSLLSLIKKTLNDERENINESEEHLKAYLSDFLKDSYYKDSNYINTKDKIDLVIHNGKTNSDPVSVIIEVKRPSNKSEMITKDKINAKAFHELVLYYMRERVDGNNINIKYLIATNVMEWYLFDGAIFEKYFYQNKQFRKYYEEWRDKRTVTSDTSLFYNDIAKPYIDKIEDNIICSYFNIKDYETILSNSDKDDDKELISLYKLLSPEHLLKVPFTNDSNSLNQNFYKELLHIIGLEEVKEGGKNIIRRKKNPDTASLLELTIEAMKTEDSLRKVTDKTIYGENKSEQEFNIALELCITWINRILFLKLLEGQLISYHLGDKDYKFLSIDKINDFDGLFNLFHRVLAVDLPSRNQKNSEKFAKVPYLNSSLFEISELEDQTIKINALEGNEELELLNSTVLKDIRTNNKKLNTLEYLFKFLDAYDFASEGIEDIQEDSKTLINASVLGKVFEKINGYKDGSIFTPGFITMYMCRQSIRLAVVQKFKETYNWNIEQFEDIKNYLADRRSSKDILEFNSVINSLKLCDPAVGSGHFLVSALNEIIAIKYELGILADDTGQRIRDYEMTIENDELIVTNDNGDIFEYTIQNGKPKTAEIQRLQKTLFHEKQNIIENCLFGVDINPNSVKICRLRLWIELLKNAYYKNTTQSLPSGEGLLELETLPNIDINIKCGNSLLSRFPLDADLSKALKTIKYNIDAYRGFVADYKNVKSREVKRELQNIINSIKGNFRTEIMKNDPKKLRLAKLVDELHKLNTQTTMFEESNKEKKAREEKRKKLEAEITKLSKDIEEIENNAIYRNAFEWRFEFPEVLNDNGDFIGFDVVIGNPPYIQLQSMGKGADVLANANYKTYIRTGDIYSLFYEKGQELLNNFGYLTFITSNKWMRAGYGEKTREFFANFTKPLQLIDFSGMKIFEAATVDVNILIFNKNLSNHNDFFACTISDDFSNDITINNYFEEHKQLMPKMNNTAWVISSNIELRIKEKIERIGTPLKDWDINIYRGVLTGFNEAFIIDGKKKDELIAADPKNAEIIKPILRGRDIKRYKAEFADLYILFIPWHFPLHKENISGNSEKAEKAFQKEYPTIYNHLLNYKIQLSNRNKAETGITYEWYALQRCANTYYEEFEKEKIVYPNMTQTPCFALSTNNEFSNDKSFILTTDKNNIKYLIAILNSNVTDFILRQICSGLGMKGLEVRKIFIENLTLPQISLEEQQPFIDLVDIILAKKENNEDTTAEEREINMLVYKLYDLTDEEIKIVEGER